MLQKLLSGRLLIFLIIWSRESYKSSNETNFAYALINLRHPLETPRPSLPLCRLPILPITTMIVNKYTTLFLSRYP